MPFVYISNLARDDVTVKLIFDHFRNLGIAALVGLAAIRQFQHILSDSVWFYSASFAMASALSVASFALFFLNYEHFIHKINATSYGKPIKAVITLFYALVVPGFLTYLFTSKG